MDLAKGQPFMSNWPQRDYPGHAKVGHFHDVSNMEIDHRVDLQKLDTFMMSVVLYKQIDHRVGLDTCHDVSLLRPMWTRSHCNNNNNNCNNCGNHKLINHKPILWSIHWRKLKSMNNQKVHRMEASPHHTTTTAIHTIDTDIMKPNQQKLDHIKYQSKTINS